MREFELVLFSTHAPTITRAVSAGVGTVIVDWETVGKLRRQKGADTEVTRDTLDDLVRVRQATRAKLVCRVNKVAGRDFDELERAIAAGTDEVLLPMVRSVAEVEEVLEQVKGRVGIGILVETVEALEHADELSQLPLARVFVGFNDLAIERHTDSIFAPLADGTLESLRRSFHAPFGFGGLTAPDLGWPIPCRLLMGEMARLGTNFSFLRRSFHRDMSERVIENEVGRILSTLDEMAARPEEAVTRDHDEFVDVLRTDVMTGSVRS